MIDYEDIGFPSTYLLWGIAGRNLAAGAICAEIADNAFGAAAGNAQQLWIEFCNDRVIFTDDGEGMVDIWKLFELGGHLHDPNKTAMDIGHFGQGAKDALLSLGWKVTVQTVREGIYHSHAVDWMPIAEAASPYAWPRRYKGVGKPAVKAPKAIRNGGTIITVSNLREGKRAPTIDALRVSLVRIFKPALRQGRKIYIKIGNRTATLDTPDIVRIDDRIEASGEVNGMTFTVIAGALLEHSPTHNRIFYGFGHRVLSEDTKLCGEGIPPLFTCDVQLGPAWKKHLQTNKLGVAAYKDDLQAAVYGLVRAVWDSTKAISDEARVDFINAKLSRTMAKIFKFTKAEAGTHDPGEDAEIGHDGKRKATKPSSQAGSNIEPRAKPDGTMGGAREKRPKASGIRYRMLDSMDENYAITVSCDDGGLECWLNGGIPAISYAYSKPFKVEAIWPVLSSGISEYLVANGDELEAFIPDYETLLEINRDDPSELQKRLFTFLMRRQPIGDEARSFEPKAAEIS